jgi:serine/threonine protein kinase
MIGETVGSYRVVSQIGVGGMGTVYLAEHPLIGKKVAIKVLRSEYLTNTEALHRFFNEARATAQLRHPALIEIFDYGIHPTGVAYIIMEYLEGETLEARIRKGYALLLPQIIDIAYQVAAGLGVAHRAGIVHRDLKPENLFLLPDPTRPAGDVVKILDFGIAKLANVTAPHQTRADALLGTPMYMSPEQCRGAGGLDHRTDIYSWGCILYAMLCRRPPFLAQSFGELIVAHLQEPPVRPRSIDPMIPESLEAIVLRALAKDPAARQQSADALLTDLRGFAASHLGTPTWGAGPSYNSAPPLTPGPSARSAGSSQPPMPSPPMPSPRVETLLAGSSMPETAVAPDFAVFAGSPAPDTTLSRASSQIRPSGWRASFAPPNLRRNALFAGGIAIAALGFAVVRVRSTPTTVATNFDVNGGAAESSAQATSVMLPPEPAHPTVEVVGSSAPLPPLTAAPGPTIGAGSSSRRPPAPAEEPPARIDFSNARDGITVTVDGKPSKLPLRIPHDGRMHTVFVQTPHFKPETLMLKGDADQSIHLKNEIVMY